MAPSRPASSTRTGKTGWRRCGWACVTPVRRVGADRPLLLVGYSNGGALAVKYTAEALERPQDPRPSRLLLLSPMIGVTPAAGLAWWISRLGVFPTSRRRGGSTCCRNTTRSSTTRFRRTLHFKPGRSRAPCTRDLSASGRRRPTRRLSADSHVPVRRRRDRQHARRRQRALRSAAGQRQRAGAVRPQSPRRHRRVRAGRGSDARARACSTGPSAATAERSSPIEPRIPSDVVARTIESGRATAADRETASRVAPGVYSLDPHRDSVPGRRSPLRHGARGGWQRAVSPGTAQPARRTSGAHRRRRYVRAPDGESVLPVHRRAHPRMGRGAVRPEDR